MNVPKEMRETYEKISKLLIEYSEKYLNKEYDFRVTALKFRDNCTEIPFFLNGYEQNVIRW